MLMTVVVQTDEGNCYSIFTFVCMFFKLLIKYLKSSLDGYVPIVAATIQSTIHRMRPTALVLSPCMYLH